MHSCGCAACTSHLPTTAPARFRCVTLRIYMCTMTPLYVWHDTFICVPWLLHMCGMTHLYVCHDSFIFVDAQLAPLIYPWLHLRFRCVTCRIYICTMTPLYLWHDAFICVPWLLYMCDMTQLYVGHDSFIFVDAQLAPRIYPWLHLLTTHSYM